MYLLNYVKNMLQVRFREFESNFSPRQFLVYCCKSLHL